MECNLVFSKHEQIFQRQWNCTNPLGECKFLVFEIFTSAYLHQITREIILLLIKDLHEKSVAESRDIKFWWRTRAICNLHSCYKKNVLDFSHSVACTFFIYIVNNVIISISFRLLVLDWKKILLKIQESYITLYWWK